jgi:hypothetical protein
MQTFLAGRKIIPQARLDDDDSPRPGPAARDPSAIGSPVRGAIPRWFARSEPARQDDFPIVLKGKALARFARGSVSSIAFAFQASLPQPPVSHFQSVDLLVWSTQHLFTSLVL